MSGKQSLQPHCLLMRALCVNEQRETHTMWTPHIVLVDWKTTGGEGSKTLFLSAFTVITFHSIASLAHMEAGMWACDCEAHLIFTYSHTYYPLFFSHMHAPQKYPFTILCTHSQTHRHTHSHRHTYTGVSTLYHIVRWPPMTHKTWKSTNQPWRSQQTHWMSSLNCLLL